MTLSFRSPSTPSVTFHMVAGAVLLMALAMVSVTGLVLHKAEADLTARMMRGVQSRLDMLVDRIRDLGPLEERTDGLYAGPQRLNGWTIVIDELERASNGGTAAIIHGTTRIAASRRPDSVERFVGKMVEPSIAETIGRTGEGLTFRYEMEGVPRITRFEPLKDLQGRVLGLVAHGVTLSQVNESLASMRLTVVIVAGLAMAIAGGALWLVIRSALRPVRHLAAVLQRVARDEVVVDDSIAWAAARGDEIGLLADAVLAVQAATSRTRVAEETATALTAQFHGLHRETQTDALTGIANRRGFEQTLKSAWSDALMTGRPVGLIMIDIDHFKKFNDHYGHQGGDDCLTRVATRIRSQVREGDVLARYGGEEFALIMPGADLHAATQAAERIRSAIVAMKLPHAGLGADGTVSLSLGVASTVPHLARGSRRLIERADQNLYEAKRAGRNRVGCGECVS